MSKLQVVHVIYDYSIRDENDLNEVITGFEDVLGGERKPYHVRLGAIDLNTILELGLIFIIGPAISIYFEGFFGLKKFEEIGEEHRREIIAFFKTLASDMDLILRSFSKIRLDFRANNRAVSLTIYFKNIPCYIVINHANCSTQILKNLPRDLIRLVRFLGETQIPEDIVVMQFYFDAVLKRWKYLLIPTPEYFGKYIDRYIDLDDGKVHLLFSEDDFLNRFHPPIDDAQKFIITPFR